MKTMRFLGLVLALCLFLGAPMLVIASLTGCGPAKTPKDVELKALAMVSDAFHETDVLCAKVGTERKDIALLTACKDLYNTARPALVVAQFYVQTGDQANFEQEVCVVITALAQEVKVLNDVGAKTPPLVTEALNLTGWFCHA